MLNFFLELILRWPRQLKIATAQGVDALIAVISFWVLWSSTNQDGAIYGVLFETKISILVSLIIFFVAVGIFSLIGFYKSVFRYAVGTVSTKLLIGSITLSFVLFTCVLASGKFQIPIGGFLIYTVIVFSFLILSRHFSEWLFNHKSSKLTKSTVHESIFIYGAEPRGVEVANSLVNHSGLAVIGFIDNDVSFQGRKLGIFSVFSPEDDFSKWLQSGSNKIIVPPWVGNSKSLGDIISGLLTKGFDVRVFPNYLDLINSNVSLSDMRHVSIEDILGRDTIEPVPELMSSDLVRKVVFISGAGGSIGGELCRQVIIQRPKKIILFDISEYALYSIKGELLRLLPNVDDLEIVALLGSVLNEKLLTSIFTEHCVDTVYHTAAYKHVSLVEENPFEGLYTNVFGTLFIARAAKDSGVAKVVHISTDKAVRPTNMMGVSKRIAELILQSLNKEPSSTSFSIVRFGNVLGSSGSVVPLFKKQIAAGGPVTVTDLNATRYFMTIWEAAQLVIQAGALTVSNQTQVPIYLLDMGKPVKIIELARQMIRLSGYSTEHTDVHLKSISIKIIGLDKGEKLHEELLVDDRSEKTIHPKINTALEQGREWPEFQIFLRKLENIIQQRDLEGLNRELKKVVE